MVVLFYTSHCDQGWHGVVLLAHPPPDPRGGGIKRRKGYARETSAQKSHYHHTHPPILYLLTFFLFICGLSNQNMGVLHTGCVLIYVYHSVSLGIECSLEGNIGGRNRFPNCEE